MMRRSLLEGTGTRGGFPMTIGHLSSAGEHAALERQFSRNALSGAYMRSVVAQPTLVSDGGVSAAGDTVEISDNVPKPIDQSALRDALRLAEKIAMGQQVNKSEAQRMRDDPVFSASVALFSYRGVGQAGDGADGKASPEERARSFVSQWPAESYKPTQADITELSRRLTQRLSGASALADGADWQARRRDLREGIRTGEFTALVATLAADDQEAS